MERTPITGLHRPDCYGELYDEVPACLKCLLLPGCAETTKMVKEVRATIPNFMKR